MASSKKVLVVTIDGPSGAGKGTIARMVAEKTGFGLLDSGALYRLTGLACVMQQIDLNDSDKTAVVARNLDVEFKTSESGVEVWLSGNNVSQNIRTEECGKYASIVAAQTSVREALLERQRDFAQPPGVVADGRDMGTVVFPDAPIKVFLTASAQERAARRLQQLEKAGHKGDYQDILAAIVERDERDSSRASAPLRAAADACLIDSTQLGIDQVFDRVMALIDAQRSE